jgi:hypothetical protein
MQQWPGPFNYIAMVEAFKQGPHSTTPLRICMNSSLEQPPPVKMSLKDCLMKSPSALVDLFTVTLSIQEHKFALTKDLSKFYQSLGTTSSQGHMPRGQHHEKDADLCHHHPQFRGQAWSCIAIAIRETVEQFGGEYPEASWFLKYRTYVDDATAGCESCPKSWSR